MPVRHPPNSGVHVGVVSLCFHIILFVVSSAVEVMSGDQSVDMMFPDCFIPFVVGLLHEDIYEDEWMWCVLVETGWLAVS